MYRLVTCPETAHLELIDYEDTPLGMLIRECSRYRPACAITCTRTCAARFDQAARDRSCTSPLVEIDVDVDVEVELELGLGELD